VPDPDKGPYEFTETEYGFLDGIARNLQGTGSQIFFKSWTIRYRAALFDEGGGLNANCKKCINLVLAPNGTFTYDVTDASDWNPAPPK